MTVAIDLPWDAIRACPSPLSSALARLDERLASVAAEIRQQGAATVDELQGVAVGHARIERLLADGRRPTAPDAGERERPPLSDDLLLHPTWRELAARQAPHAAERDLVLLLLAHELFAHYGTVFGYLNDDLTRRWPTRALVLRVLAQSDGQRETLCDAMAPSAPLVTAGIIRCVDAGAERGWAAAGLTLTPLATALLGGAITPAYALPDGVTASPGAPLPPWLAQGEISERLRAITADESHDAPRLIAVLEGRAGSGRTALARDLAQARGVPLLRVDLSGNDAAGSISRSDARAGHASALRDALLFQQLSGAVVLLDGMPAAAGESASPMVELPGWLSAATGPVLCRTTRESPWRALLARQRTVLLEMPPVTSMQRSAIWQSHLGTAGVAPSLAAEVAPVLSGRFDLTPGAVSGVVAQVKAEGALMSGTNHTTRNMDTSDRKERAAALTETLSQATRRQSRDALGRLAVQVATPHDWSDLVLPPVTLSRLREFAAAARDRVIVLDQWQFGGKATSSRGMTALFCGPSGTGKTMACGVVARDLGLDLYLIDLSSVVSKYIGETEKNLDRVFRAARDAGAMLFFDEADALFGKRSEVKDAHDRYANIEVAYLLQQLESHPGIVALASNLGRNLDAAFSRRMRYVVEFPLPADADRLRLWRGVLPAAAPLGADVDLPFLAAGFPIAGGDIRNVALDAAYLAAADGGASATITMRHFVEAMARQCVKQGVTPSAVQFRQYAALLPRLS